MPDQRLTYLFDRFLRNEHSPGEARELAALVLNSQKERDVRELLEKFWQSPMEESAMPQDQAEALLQDILSHQPVPLRQPVKLRRFSWKRIAVAASIVIAVSIASYFIFFRREENKAEIVQAEDIEAPKLTKATITLADGRTVSVQELTPLTQNNVSLTKTTDGRIVYAGSNTEIIYNTLTNPRGSKVIDMQLADGSLVWLNAGSSITYPVAFMGNERKVSISGEAYFEIAHNPAMPFKVAKDQTEIKVLGTHFNVNAYNDEENIKVTLLEGSVKVSSQVSGQKAEVTIKPGEQAVTGVNLPLTIHHSPDLEEVMAWKNGKFSFNRADIKTVMRELARWYDLQVDYRGGTTKDLFGGEMQRSLPLSKVLEFLEKSQVHFEVNDNKVTVLP